MLKFALVTVATIVLVYPTASRPLDQDQQKRASQLVKELGMNCPHPTSFEEAGEDERGRITKINCLSADKAKSWTLRLIIPPDGKRRIEAW